MPSALSPIPRFSTNHLSASIILGSFALIFALSIHSTVTARKSYDVSFRPWRKQDCKVDGSKTRDCLTHENRYTYIVLVNDTSTAPQGKGQFPPQTPAVNTTDPSICPFKTKDAADAEREQKYKPGSTVTCYVAPDGPLVRLTPGGYTTSEQRKRRVRFIFSVVSTVILGLIAAVALRRAVLVFFFPHRAFPYGGRRSFFGGGFTRGDGSSPRISSSGYAGNNNPFLPTVPPRAGGHRHFNHPHLAGMSNRRPMLAPDARALATALRDNAPPEEGAVCPICLEDLATPWDNGEDDDGSTHGSNERVKLPCGHAYHDECIAQWFRKGSPSCPYCNHDLSELIATTLQPRRSSVSTTATLPTPPLGPQQRTSAVGGRRDLHLQHGRRMRRTRRREAVAEARHSQGRVPSDNRRTRDDNDEDEDDKSDDDGRRTANTSTSPQGVGGASVSDGGSNSNVAQEQGRRRPATEERPRSRTNSTMAGDAE